MLDSPGLHSTEEKNGNLTKQFVDSADAVLWLTPSSSPGQVQELDELKYELEKGKPLLPVITRSDETEEDWDEVAQDIIAVVKDKTPDNRKLQEEDVYGRLEQKQKSEGTIKARKPISISVYTFKCHQDLNKAGFARLFNEMAELVKKAANYKGGKANKQIENFINENVLSFLNSEIKTQISSISTQTENVLSKLEKDRKMITDLVEGNAHNHTYEIVNKHRKSRNKNAIVQDINSLISQALGQEIAKRLEGFVSSLSQISVQLDSASIKDFEDRKITYQQERGASKKSLAQAGGAAGGGAAGAAIGTAILPGVGTAIGGVVGGLLGGLLGGAAGSAMIDIETVTEVVGVDTEQMEKSLKEQISNGIKQTVDHQLNNIIAQIRQLQDTCNSLEREVDKLIKEFKR